MRIPRCWLRGAVRLMGRVPRCRRTLRLRALRLVVAVRVAGSMVVCLDRRMAVWGRLIGCRVGRLLWWGSMGPVLVVGAIGWRVPLARRVRTGAAVRGRRRPRIDRRAVCPVSNGRRCHGRRRQRRLRCVRPVRVRWVRLLPVLVGPGLRVPRPLVAQTGFDGSTWSMVWGGLRRCRGLRIRTVRATRCIAMPRWTPTALNRP